MATTILSHEQRHDLAVQMNKSLTMLIENAILYLKNTYGITVYDNRITNVDYTYIVPLPNDLYYNDKKLNNIQDIIKTVFSSFFINTTNMMYYNGAVYDTNWYGNSFHIYNVGPHIGFSVTALNNFTHHINTDIIELDSPWECNITELKFKNVKDTFLLEKKYNMQITYGTYTYIIRTKYS